MVSARIGQGWALIAERRIAARGVHPHSRFQIFFIKLLNLSSDGVRRQFPASVMPKQPLPRHKDQLVAHMSDPMRGIPPKTNGISERERTSVSVEYPQIGGGSPFSPG